MAKSGGVPTFHPSQSLGKTFDCTLKESASIRATNQELDRWLMAVYKSGLLGKFKAWIYQHGILPRILWLLLVYEFTLSTVKGFEKSINSHLQRWLGLPRSLSSINVREVMQYIESNDLKASQAGTEVKNQKKIEGNRSSQPSGIRTVPQSA
ncbi:hypothetical protein QTP70_016829, partial [Hemibagrus guttatus]